MSRHILLFIWNWIYFLAFFFFEFLSIFLKLSGIHEESTALWYFSHKMSQTIVSYFNLIYQNFLRIVNVPGGCLEPQSILKHGQWVSIRKM